MVIRDESVLGCVRVNDEPRRERKDENDTHDLFSVGNENVETVDLSFVKGESVVTVTSLLLAGESDDTLLGLD